jgi:hypothetical protein
MIRRAVIGLLLLVTGVVIGFLSGCGYDGYYRYPCQDPANITTDACLPPLCEYNDQCSTDMMRLNDE